MGESMMARAVKKQLVGLNIVDLRPFGDGRHLTVDDASYGGDGGMIIKVAPVARAMQALPRPGHVVLTTPRGRIFTQEDALRFSRMEDLTLICGHYEGVDERVCELFVDEEISIGDYVLTGGEIPAMVMADAVIRLIPGVLGRDTLETGDSHYDGLLEHPHYTRPSQYEGLAVPEVLLSGDHERIRRWRRKMALIRTRDERPDLFGQVRLSAEDMALIDEDLE